MKPITSGRIELHFHCECVVCSDYHSFAEKENIIAKWKRLYAKAFDRAEVIDTPDKGAVPKPSQFSKGDYVKRVHLNRQAGRKLIKNEF